MDSSELERLWLFKNKSEGGVSKDRTTVYIQLLKDIKFVVIHSFSIPFPIPEEVFINIK